MGCGSSRGGLEHVDDSVHVMLKHDKKMQKKRGEKPHGYVPRAEHPLMKEAHDQQAAQGEANTGDVPGLTENGDTK